MSLDKEFVNTCTLGDFEKIEKLLSENNFKLKTLECGFNQACEKGHIDIIYLLLESNPNINISTENEYAFRWACHNGKLEVVKLLLEIKPEINISAENEWAFRFACHNYNRYVKNDQHLLVADLLLKLKPEIDISTYDYAVFTYAIRCKHKEVLDFLTDKYPELKDKFNY